MLKYFLILVLIIGSVMVIALTGSGDLGEAIFFSPLIIFPIVIFAVSKNKSLKIKSGTRDVITGASSILILLTLLFVGFMIFMAIAMRA